LEWVDASKCKNLGGRKDAGSFGWIGDTAAKNALVKA
jgi:hypothetical protein